MNSEYLLGMTADIVSAHVSHNSVAVNDVPNLVMGVFSALNSLSMASEPSVECKVEHMPAVSVKKSLINPEVIVSMIDGKPYKMLRRHLARNGLTPDTYRERYGLPKGYPMTAPAYAERRREIAVKTGLGRKPKGKK